MKTPVEHPNTMIIEVFDKDTKIAKHTFVSIGGGKIEIDGKKGNVDPEIYPHTKMDDIQVYCNERHLRLDQYIDEVEDSDFDSYMNQIFKQMLKTVNTGLKKTGVLPGSLKIVVTAPTMGSCGVLPSLVYHFYHDQKYPKKTIIQGLKVAGLIGNLIQTNATISGAKAGCQAEVGAACSMGAAFVAYCQLQNNEQIECAAEIGLEHHLGLTCDPVGGYVMIPCIERNAIAAQRSVDAARLAKYLRNVKKNRVSFDMVVQTMNLTGKKLPIELKESALGGLAVVVPEKA